MGGLIGALVQQEGLLGVLVLIRISKGIQTLESLSLRHPKIAGEARDDPHNDNMDPDPSFF